MKDIQAHAKKIRSDAAECLMLSNLVGEERRHLFGRIAEHLNSLALEIETEIAKSTADAPIAAPAQVDLGDHHTAPPGRLQRQLALSLLVALLAVAGAVFWAMNRTELSSFLFANLQPKPESVASETNQRLTALLSEDARDREAIRDQLSALNARLDGLVKTLDELKSSQTAVPTSSARASAGQSDQSPAAETKPSAADERGTQTETSSVLPSVHPAAPEGTASAQPANVAGDASDQVGTIAPIRAELEPRKRATGRADCLHFRSYDPASGTYMTYDRRRRPCR